ncbi:MAG: aldo/keto reductase, partial [Comamonadaceae bacterium]
MSLGGKASDAAAIRHWDRLGNGGLDFSRLGLGTAPLGNLYRAIGDDEASATLQAAWDQGMRYFDTAPQYGLGTAERRLGRFLFERRTQPCVLSTKVGRLLQRCAPAERTGLGKFFEVPSRKEVFDYSYDGVMRSMEFSLERMGVDRIDVLYAHDLDVFSHGSVERRDHFIDQFMAGGYRACLALRDQGVIKAFGAGVNEARACEILAERGDFDIFLLAGRYTLLEQAPLDDLLPLCLRRGIGVVLGGVFNSGILATGARPGAFYNYDPAPQSVLDRVSAMEAVCQRHGVRLIEAALQFPLAHPAVTTVIVGAQRPDEAASTTALLDKPIPAALWQELQSLGLLRADAPV